MTAQLGCGWKVEKSTERITSFASGQPAASPLSCGRACRRPTWANREAETRAAALTDRVPDG